MEDKNKPLSMAEIAAEDAGEIRGMQIALAYLLCKIEGQDASQIIKARSAMLAVPEEVEGDQYAQIRNAMCRDAITRIANAAIDMIEG